MTESAKPYTPIEWAEVQRLRAEIVAIYPEADEGRWLRSRDAATITAREKEIAALKAEVEKRREQRDDESWKHAACLSIAEGASGWRGIQVAHRSLAMEKVMKLRDEYESLRAEVEGLRGAGSVAEKALRAAHDQLGAAVEANGGGYVDRRTHLGCQEIADARDKLTSALGEGK